MDHCSVAGLRQSLYAGIQHGVDKLSVGARANGPAHYHLVDAIDDRRQVDLLRRDLEHCYVGQPFLVGRCRLEVTIDDVLGRGTDLAEVRRVTVPRIPR